MTISYEDESKEYITKVTSSYFYNYEILLLKYYFVNHLEIGDKSLKKIKDLNQNNAY